MDNQYRLKIELKSDTLIGSGEGWGGVIDSDIVFDDLGIPYIPARRIKGCLKEAALELTEAFACSKLNDLPLVDDIFGSPGQKDCSLMVSNAYLEDYTQMRQWLQNIKKEYQGVYSPEAFLSTFTGIRRQTAINDEGVALDNSLRTSRVLNSGLIFYCDLSIPDKPKAETLLLLSAVVLRRIGKMRNRGFGEIKCRLLKDKQDITDAKIARLEDIISQRGIQ